MRIVALGLFVLVNVAVPAQADILVNVSKAQQRASVLVDGTEVYRWAVSTGVRGYDTPSGVFRPHDIERHWYSRQYSRTPMPWAVFFHRGYAMHATTEVYNLGRLASHGCVRLRPDNAATLYSLVRRQGLANTKIVVMNGALPSLPVPTVKPPAPTVKPGEPGMVERDDAVQSFAKADLPETTIGEEFAAKAHNAEAAVTAEPSDDPVPRRVAKYARTVGYRFSVSNDEAQILRERADWLRSLDRKYGISH